MIVKQKLINFDRRLSDMLAISGVERRELACHLGVPLAVVNRWLNGISAPDVYQFVEIADFLGQPYDWFLEGRGSLTKADGLATKLGLSPDTVKAMLEMGEYESPAVLAALDKAVYSVIVAINTAYDDLNDAVNTVMQFCADTLKRG